MRRRSDWRSALHGAIEAARNEPFSWETGADCALFAADCVLAMTGEDLAKEFRGRYRDAAGAMRALKRAGYEDVVALAAKHLEEVPPVMARRGDIVAYRADGTGWSLGVVIGEVALARDQHGLASVDRLAASKAFRVP